jgi:hypothetical protein
VKSHLTSHIVSHSFVTLVSAESQYALSMLPLDTSQYSTSSFGLWVIISCSRPSSNRSLLLHRNRRRKLVKAGFVDARRHHYAFSFTSPRRRKRLSYEPALRRMPMSQGMRDTSPVLLALRPQYQHSSTTHSAFLFAPPHAAGISYRYCSPSLLRRFYIQSAQSSPLHIRCHILVIARAAT